MADFLLDSFTGGAGPLSGHTGETGTPWATYVSGGGLGPGISACTIDGSGHMKNLTQNAFIKPNNQPAGDYWVELKFFVPAGFTNCDDYIVLIRTAAGHAYSNPILQLTTQMNSTGAFYIQAETLSGFATGGVPDIFYDDTGINAYPANTTHTLRIEVSDAIKTVKMNGTTLFTFTDNSAPTPFLALFIASGGGGSYIDSIEGFSTAAGQFWTNYVKTTEVDS